MLGSYLRISQSRCVGGEVKLDTIYSSRQRDTTDQQCKHHNIGKGRCEVNNLEEQQKTQRQTSGFAQTAERRAQCRVCNLSRSLDSFPDAEVANDPAQEKTPGQVPADSTHLLDSTRQTQDPSPEHSTPPLVGHILAPGPLGCIDILPEFFNWRGCIQCCLMGHVAIRRKIQPRANTVFYTVKENFRLVFYLKGYK